MSRAMHTYSIVDRDPQTGEMGVAVQSHWFSVGALCPWAEAGVGAIATQSFVNVSYGPRGLALLKKGKRASEVFSQDPNWRTLTGRLPGVDLLGTGEETLQRIVAQGVQR